MNNIDNTIGHITYKDVNGKEQSLAVGTKFWGDKRPLPTYQHMDSVLRGRGIYPFTDPKFVPLEAPLTKSEVNTYLLGQG